MPPKKKRVGDVDADAVPDGTRRPGKEEQSGRKHSGKKHSVKEEPVKEQSRRKQSGKEEPVKEEQRRKDESGRKEPVKEEQRRKDESGRKQSGKKQPGRKEPEPVKGAGATREGATGGGRVGSVEDSRAGEKKVSFSYSQLFQLYQLDDRFKDGLKTCGLQNVGNSCFANVVLQCLSHTRLLVAYLVRKNHARLCYLKRNGDWCLFCELQTLVETAASEIPFAPLSILDRLPQLGGNLCVGEQEDAHEFMRFAIDKMQETCLTEFGGEKALDFQTQRTTIIHYIFRGQLQSKVRCAECQNESNRYEDFLDLSIEIDGNVTSLEECLDQFTALELIDGENKYSCSTCKDYVKAQKQLTIYQAPNILTITLKRFQSGRYGKIIKRIDFPMKLDLRRYMSTADETDQYNLYAVVVHLDRQNDSFSGHYVCYIKNYEDQWKKIDDSKVMPVSEDEVLAQCAYMLLYSRTAAVVEAAFGAGVASVPDAGLGGRADAHIQDVAGRMKDAVVDGAPNAVGGGARRPKVADFSADSGKEPKKDGARDPQKKEDDPKDSAGTGTAAVEAGSSGEPYTHTTKLSRKLLRLQRKAGDSFSLEPQCGPIVDDEIIFIEGNETKPKKVKKGKIGRREAGPLEQKEDGEVDKLDREALRLIRGPLEQKVDELDREALRLIRGPLEQKVDKLDREALRLIRELCSEYARTIQQAKKTGKKESHRGGGEWLEVDIESTKGTDPIKEALDLCELYEAMVKVVTHHNFAQQKTVADNPIRVSWRPTSDDLTQYSHEVMELFKLCSPFSITLQLSDGDTIEVPVTAAKPDDPEDITYYIVALVRDEDEAEVHLLIDLFSNYLDAFRIVLKDEVADEKPWLILGKKNKLPKRFKKFKNLKCEEGYRGLSEVYLHKERIPEVFCFFMSYDVPFPEKKDATYDEEIMLFTSFVCFCEINRLGFMKSWVLDGVTRERHDYLKLLPGYPVLVRDWTYLGKLVFMLQLALLEKPMLESLPVGQREKSPFYWTMTEARNAWKGRQELRDAITFFFKDQDEMKLNWLCGSHVTLLRHDYELCDKVLLRFLGYEGYWREKIRVEYQRMLEDAAGDGEDAPGDGEDAPRDDEGTSDG